MRTALITPVSGRHGHLLKQVEAGRRGTLLPDLHVVVAMDDPQVADLVPDATVVALPRHDDGLPLAAARNAGARAALDGGADLLVFLDVDCLPAPAALHRYAVVAASRDGVLCGPVGYLPPAGPDGYDLAALASLAEPHPARPVPSDDEVLPADAPDLFWSLSFALSAGTWARTGGFCEEYVGYGAEDTDFGWTLAQADVPMWWVGGAWAYHQHHGSSGPPVQHLDALLRNGAVFARRWGRWPMPGWFEEFAARGLVRRDGDGWVRA